MMARALGLLAVTSVYAFTHDESAACYASRYPDLHAAFCATDRCDTHALHDHYKNFGATEKRLWGCRGAHNPFGAPRAAHVRPAAAPGNPVAYRTAARAGRGRVEKEDDVSVRSYLRGSRFVSTRPYLSNDVYWELAEQVNARATGPPPIIFVPVAVHGLTAAWLRKLLSRRTAPFVLVTTPRDVDTPRRRGDALDVLLKDPRVVCVYAKNALYSSEKLRPLPLGTKWQYTSGKFFGEPETRLRLKKALEAAGAGSAEKTRALFETSPRPSKILVGYVSSTHPHRRRHAEALRTSPAASIITTARKKSFRGYLEDLRAAAFVFSPPGAGRDCHRHWEALLMGAVPIVVQDNTNAKLFEGLPVWRVESYGNISYEEVEKQHARFHGPGTNWDFGKLYTDFWLREFTNAADEIAKTVAPSRPAAAEMPVVPSQRPLAEYITEYSKSQARSSRERLAKERRPKPTLQKPFVFMHQRKTGGTSMRDMLVRAAQRNNLTYWVACANVNCESYDPPVDGTANNFAVFGAHTYWPGVKKALAIARAKRPHGPGPHLGSNAPFECYTSFREPLSRVASCWDYREFRAFAGENISAIPPAKYGVYLADGRSDYDEGCNNEPLRVLSDSGRAEEKVNKLTSGTGGELWRDADGWALDAAATLERTLAHLTEHCVVGVLERCEDTKASVEFFFPWLAASFDCGVHLHPKPLPWKGGGSAHSDLTRAEEAEIKRQNQLEYMAYDVANRLLDAQLEVVAAARRARRKFLRHVA